MKTKEAADLTFGAVSDDWGRRERTGTEEGRMEAWEEISKVAMSSLVAFFFVIHYCTTADTSSLVLGGLGLEQSLPETSVRCKCYFVIWKEVRAKAQERLAWLCEEPMEVSEE